MKELIKHLERIAETNNDEFYYVINISPFGKDKINYSLVVSETAEDHHFIVKSGDSIEEIVQNITKKDLKKCCDNWNYKYID